MPIHDWTRVNAGTFHDFHGSWITHIKESLNGGLLPHGFYAMAEQHAGRMIGDVITFQAGEFDSAFLGSIENGNAEVGSGEASPFAGSVDDSGTIAVAEAPPRVQRTMKPVGDTIYRSMRKTIAIHRATTHHIVALLEILSPANKDRADSVQDFVSKAWSALGQGIHFVAIDLFPPSRFDPQGIHGEIWKYYDSDDYDLPADMPLTLASYAADEGPKAYIEHAAVGDPLHAMPLFLDRGRYINLPLEETYQTAWRGVPGVWRAVIER